MRPSILSPERLIPALRRHPRLVEQKLYEAEPDRARLVEQIPPLVPFRGGYAVVLPVLDWDHRLPSKQLILRLYLYYTGASAAAGEASYADRLAEIKARDRFPEFDVPDFVDLHADESYEAEIADDGTFLSWRLVSPWRREVSPPDGALAVAVARSSPEYGKVAGTVRERHLGDLEAVSWTPPSESQHARWTLDVWYLLAFDGRVGSGRSFLVDLEEKRVITVRDFSVRTQ